MTAAPQAAQRRFRAVDPYRVDREWARYEGNALRDLFRALRERFLLRHAASAGPVLDVGAGPGRFSLLLGGGRANTILLDLSAEMLRRAREELGPEPGRPVSFVCGDANRPPFPEHAFSLVAALGNVVGFLPGVTWPAPVPLGGLVGQGGKLLIEIVPGVGERSSYLTRLPPTAVARLLRSPLSLVRGRVLREGFRVVPRKVATDHGFRRLSPRPLQGGLPIGWQVEEVVAVAPALGFDLPRLTAVRADPKAWRNLLLLEEELGRMPERWDHAAAVLVALRRS